MRRPCRFWMLWIGLTLGNFIAVPLGMSTKQKALDRTFFQLVALGVASLSIPGEKK